MLNLHVPPLVGFGVQHKAVPGSSACCKHWLGMQTRKDLCALTGSQGQRQGPPSALPTPTRADCPGQLRQTDRVSHLYVL